MVGCPYAEEDCKQNIYAVDFKVYYPDEAALIFTMREEVDISGFSGAPLLDENGNVLGVVIGTSENGGVKFIHATFIREIRRIE